MVRGGFDRMMKDGVVYYAVSFLERTGLVRAVFSTRIGGVSTGETATMNFSALRADSPENVRENYRRLCAAAGIPPESLTVSRQVHGIHVREVGDGDAGRGVFDDGEVHEADGLMTARRGAALVKLSADCVPVYILDPSTPAVAMVHAGWRGTLDGIAAEALRRMGEVYGTRPRDCLAAVGPSIGPCCFEVGCDVADQFAGRYPRWDLVSGSARPRVDLWRCNAMQLLDAGLAEDGVAVSGLCTACDAGTFHSHRRERGKTGVMAAILALV